MQLSGDGEVERKIEATQHGEITTGRPVPVAAAKVRIPATAPAALVRERLHSLLDAAVAGTDVGPSVTVVCAPAGSGKTTVLSMWARQRVDRGRGRVAWVSVDTEDNEPALLWSAVLRALEVSGVWGADGPPVPVRAPV